jgi:hypothetical protein
MIEKKLHVKDIKNAYRWKSLIDAGVTLIAGSDAPVESINPFYGIDAFLNRKPKFNNLYLKENISFEEALAAYITNPRKISGTINDSGAIEKNKNGDLIIINNNIQNSDSSSVNNTIVIATYFNGERVYFNVDYLNDKS